jgi:hypothetical protein
MRRNEFQDRHCLLVQHTGMACTDIGIRTILAICLDDTEVVECSPGPLETKTIHILSRSETQAIGLFNGPPHAATEYAFDEHDMEGCSDSREQVEPSN